MGGRFAPTWGLVPPPLGALVPVLADSREQDSSRLGACLVGCAAVLRAAGDQSAVGRGRATGRLMELLGARCPVISAQ